MNIEINLNAQTGSSRNKRVLRVASVIMLGLTIICLVALFYESTFLLWAFLLYFLLYGTFMFFHSRGMSILDLIGKSYLILDGVGIEMKPRFYNKQVISVKWKAVEEYRIKLFEIVFLQQGNWISFDLEQLTDSNLKLVKDFVTQVQQQKTKAVS